MSLSVADSLITALFLIFLAESAYLSVDNDSSKLSKAGEIAQIITVLEFPPKALASNLVNALSLYGIFLRLEEF